MNPERILSFDKIEQKVSPRVSLESLEALHKLANPLSKFEKRLSQATPDQINLLEAVNYY